VTHEELSWIVIANSVVQLAGLVVIIALAIRGFRESARLSRAIAGLLSQESEKTRARLDELLGPQSR
jgi:hypothetical protein